MKLVERVFSNEQPTFIKHETHLMKVLKARILRDLILVSFLFILKGMIMFKNSSFFVKAYQTFDKSASFLENMVRLQELRDRLLKVPMDNKIRDRYPSPFKLG